VATPSKGNASWHDGVRFGLALAPLRVFDAGTMRPAAGRADHRRAALGRLPGDVVLDAGG